MPVLPNVKKDPGRPKMDPINTPFLQQPNGPKPDPKRTSICQKVHKMDLGPLRQTHSAGLGRHQIEFSCLSVTCLEQGPEDVHSITF